MSPAFNTIQLHITNILALIEANVALIPDWPRNPNHCTHLHSSSEAGHLKVLFSFCFAPSSKDSFKGFVRRIPVTERLNSVWHTWFDKDVDEFLAKFQKQHHRDAKIT
jgi:hypothetical protein